MREHARRERGRLTAAIGLAHDSAQREAAHPVAAALVAEHVAPSTRSRRAAVAIAAVRDRPGAGDDDDAGGGADTRLQRDQRVVDDENAGLVSDAAHDAANDGRILRAVDAGDAEADGGGNGILLRHRFFHHRVQNLLELQLANAPGDWRPGLWPSTRSGLRRRREGKRSLCRRRRCQERARDQPRFYFAALTNSS